MRTVPTLLATLLFAAGLTSVDADESLFEDESLTVTVSAQHLGGSFDKVKAQPLHSDSNILRAELEADNPEQIAPGLDVTYSWNWDDVFFAVSGIAVVGLETPSTSVLSEVYYSNTSYLPEQKFTLSQVLSGALVEFGWRSTATEWIYIATGGSAGTTYGDPVFHFGFGIGPYLHTIFTDQKELAGTEVGWTASFRYQHLLWEGLGLEIVTRGFVTDGMNRGTMTVGAGLLYKVF